MNNNTTPKRRYPRIYYIFHGIKSRCNSSSGQMGRLYGEKGVKCLWKSFEEFKNDMGESYQNHVKIFGERDTTIDRINSNGNYCKENCRWATLREQAGNTSQARFITYNEQTKNVSEWSRVTGINYQTLINRLNAGWSIDKVFSKV